jgi:hypothetical protein
LVAATLPRRAIDDRAIHVNATSTRVRLFGAVGAHQSGSMSVVAEMENTPNQRLT